MDVSGRKGKLNNIFGFHRMYCFVEMFLEDLAWQLRIPKHPSCQALREAFVSGLISFL